MGVTLRQKTKGKGQPWWVFISYNGTRTSRQVGSKKAAEEVASKIEAKLKLGEFNFESEKPVATFKEYADSWIKTTGLATCKESTVENHTRLLKNHIISVFGDMKVTDVTRGYIKSFLHGKINDGYTKSTVNNLRAVISDVLNEAVDDETIPANPTHKLGRIGKKEDANISIDPLTSEELKKLLDTVRMDKELSGHYPLFLLLNRTGVRIGEGIALRWDDVDFNGRFIKVERTFSSGRIGTPKNGKSRKVDMSMQLTETLKDHQTASKKKGLALGLGDAPEYIFTNEKGGLIDKDNWRRRVFNKALKKAGLRKIRIHDMRHGYATLRLSKGDNIVDVANQLGDNIAVVLKVYAHWIPGKKKDEIDALDDVEYTFEFKKTENEK